MAGEETNANDHERIILASEPERDRLGKQLFCVAALAALVSDPGR
jgi:hypothetical protein